MRKVMRLLLAAVILSALAVLVSCNGGYIDPGHQEVKNGNGTKGPGTSGGFGDDERERPSGGGNGGGGSSGGNSGILTFSDTLPSSYMDYVDVFIIANSTNTSASNWENNASIVAHYNTFFGYADTTAKTVPLSIPRRPLTVAEPDDVSSSDTVWKGSGTYAIYVSPYFGTAKILKGVQFSNGCATVRWSDFTNL